jgi:signal transduction histidine kinase
MKSTERTPGTPLTEGDLLTTLLERLAPHMTEATGSSAGAASTLQACASEIRRYAEEADEGDGPGFESLSVLLLEVSSLIERSERRWSRLGFDIHDSVLQEVAALRMILSAFRSGHWTAGTGDTGELEGLSEFLDEVDGRLESLDRSLRELVDSFETPALIERPFRESVRALVGEFTSSAHVPVRLDLRGDFELLTRSQRIALFRILVEAMSNVRKHSGASRVWVTARVVGKKVRLRVRDNGKGFDATRTTRLAASRGRRGLLGMAERVRLLGGRFELSSRRGGPTTIAVTLPAGRVHEHTPAAREKTKRRSAGVR